MIWIIGAALGVGLLVVPLARLYRGCLPTIVEAYDARDRATAFDVEHRRFLEAAGFSDEGAQLILIGGTPAVMHLYGRATDGTVVTGLSRPDGSQPAHYLSTLLAEGGGWLDTRASDRTPGPRQELVQVMPGASLQAMLAGHDRALQAIMTHGVAPVRTVGAFELHMHQARATRRSLLQNPFRWIVGLAAKAMRPDTPREVATMPGLQRRLDAMRLA